MDSADTDDLFRRFARTADTRALAAFYDRVAPELLLVAAHLGAPGADGEDLVQATFLAAIERVAAYDPRRPAMPWLVGILVNQAKRARRRREHRPETAGLDPAIGPDPAHVVEDAELAEQLAARMRALPAGYRETMTLRFVHGLMPLQIAHALGIPPDTVKSRLRRGTEMIRKALPVGFASAIAAVVTPGRGLAAVRAVVLEAAAARAAQHAGLALAGTAAAWKRGWLLAGVAVAAVVTTLAVDAWSGGTGVPTPPAGPAATTVADTPPPQPSAAPPAASPSPARSPVPGEAADPGLGGRLVVAVRHHDGTPAVAAHVALTPRFGGDALLRRTWVVTDAAGDAAVQIEPGAYTLAVARGGEGDAVVPPAGAARTVLTVPAGIQLRGRVHESGTPVAGASVWLSVDGRPDEGRIVATTAADGTFAVRDVARGRTCSVLARGYVPRPLVAVDAPDGAVHELDVDLRELRSNIELTGRVVDEEGAPIAGARIQLGRRLPHYAAADPGMGRDALVPPIELVSDGDGRFGHCGLVVFDRALEVWARAAGHALRAEKISFQETMAREVTLTLVRGVGLNGRATDQRGAPAAGAVVTARDANVTDWQHAPRWAQVDATAAADGSFVLAGVPQGPIVLAARDGGGARAGTTLDTTERRTWDCVLAPPLAIHGVVRDEKGAPVAGLRVRALVGPGRQEPPPATTDARGAFVVRDCDEGSHMLALTLAASPWPGSLTTRAGVHGSADVHELVVDRSAIGTGSLCARVVDEDGVPLAAKVMVAHLRDGRAFATTDPVSGRFRVGPLPALGPHWLVLVEDDAGRYAIRDGIDVPPAGDVDLGDLVLSARQPPQVEVETETRDPLVVRIALPGGTPIGGVAVRDGKGIGRPLPPGEYVAHVVSETLAQSPARVHVRRGEEARVVLRPAPTAFTRTFRFAHPVDDPMLRMDLRWQGAEGAPRCVDRVEWRHDRPLVCRQAFAPGTYRLEAVSQTGRRAEVEFEVGPGMDAEPVQVDLQ